MGALLVVAVVAIAILVPSREGRRLAGTPSLIPLPADPVVGDCLLEPTADFFADIRQAPAELPTSSSVNRNVARPGPAPVFGRCTGSVAGEVVAIISAVGDSAARRLQIASSGLDCRAAALDYAGLVQNEGNYSIPGATAVDPVLWRLSVDLRGTWVLPGELLQAAGRSWAACVVAPTSPDRYSGTIAGAYRDGRLPDAFGTCWDLPESSARIQTLPCNEPHQAELISSGRVPDRAATTAVAIQQSCEELAAGVIRRTDPTAGGGITVRVSPETLDSQTRRAANLDVVCFVIPTEHSLAGTVVGIGDRPIPYAG